MKDKKKFNSIDTLNFFETYLKYAIATCSNSETLLQFLEISYIPKQGDFKKYKETYVRKRAGGRYNENKIILRCGAFWKCWNKRYLIITSEGVMYTKSHKLENSLIRENLLFDHHFVFEYGKKVFCFLNKEKIK